LLRAPSNLALSTAREGAATASLGNLGQGLTTLTGKNFLMAWLIHWCPLHEGPACFLLQLQRVN